MPIRNRKRIQRRAPDILASVASALANQRTILAQLGHQALSNRVELLRLEINKIIRQSAIIKPY